MAKINAVIIKIQSHLICKQMCLLFDSIYSFKIPKAAGLSEAKEKMTNVLTEQTRRTPAVLIKMPDNKLPFKIMQNHDLI